MKRYMISLIFLAVLTPAIAQKVNWKKLSSLNPDKLLLSGERQPARVLLLGTFHFAYPNLDEHITDSSLRVDVLSEQRQKEIKQLAEVIKRFKPTRIYIESTRQSFHDSLYKEYLSGNFKLDRNEIYQVAYRVGKELNLPKMYAVDASSFATENSRKYRWIDSMWNGKPVDRPRDIYWNKLYDRLYNVGDSIDKTLTILENFLLMAQPSVLKRMQGAYMTGGFNTHSNDGPDIIAMWWFSRNLRIFNNILKTQPGSNDRILVLFGNAHIPTLKHCFEASPEFKVVELRSLLK
ncbi:MAG TPA: DUF5694 domain-containing protein [Chitinophagaceae bacterium]|nr:DUF5694 domain-containing protein [Chitinophagaceae bacterium]